jgi:hypothetical protein
MSTATAVNAPHSVCLTKTCQRPSNNLSTNDVLLSKVLLINARSLNNKLKDLDCLLDVSKPDILCVTETWFKSTCIDSSICRPGYSVFRKDRPNNREGGGVCIFTNNESVTSSLVTIPVSFSSLELVVVDVFFVSPVSKFRLFLSYRPPCRSECSIESTLYTTLLCQCIQSLYPTNSTVLLCGDFNFPSIKWNNNLNILTNTDTSSGIFLDFVYNNCLTQFVTQPTRINHSLSRNGSLLDLVFCNDSNFVHNVQVSAPFSSSDHCSVEFDIIRDVHIFQSDISTYDFNQADWASIASFLDNVDFFSLFSNCADIYSIVNNFYDVVFTAISQFVPFHAKTKLPSQSRYPLRVRRLLSKKSTAWTVYRNFRTAQSLAKYKSIASQCRLAIYKYHVEVENKVINSNNINKFFRFANRKFSCRSPVGPLKSNDNSLIIDPIRKAELLQNVFSSMFTIDNHHTPVISSPSVTDSGLNNIIFSPLLVKRAISKLKVKTKGGPDGLPPVFIKKCSDQLSSPLAYVFSQCMEHGFMPPDWLRAYVTPVYKKGDATNPLNYRPIALTCTICKIMESIIKDQLLNYLLRKNLIDKHQHGFLSKHSTTSNLLESTHDWIVSFTSRRNVDVVYIDFSRAFDSIVFTKLIAKLSHYGISGKLLSFLSAFLHNREQCVVLENCFSSTSSVLSGVPQGSVLGPVLFIIFINDVSSVCIGNTKHKLFADDVKLYTSFNIDDSNCSNLQQSLDQLSSWASLWQLDININKCCVLPIRNKSSSSISHPYFINGLQLSCSSSVSDLGITIDSRLSFNQHISNVLTKATQRSGAFFRGFASRHPVLVKKTFVSYIRPLLEYNSNIWNPTRKYLIDKLENIQRRFTKRVPSISHLSYIDRLRALDLEPLELRRLHSDLIQYYKIVNSLSSLDPDLYFNLHYPPPSLRNHAPFLIKPSNFSTCLQSSFFYRYLDCWNELPTSVTQSPSLQQFKNLIKSFDFSKYLKGSAWII